MSEQYLRPRSNRNLRALLRIIERGYSQEDLEALDDAYDLADGIKGYEDSLREYINGLSDHIREGDESEYRMYTNDDLRHMKLELEKQAYGDFDEAMADLEYDLRGLDIHRKESALASRVFRPELFDKEDRVIWTELQAIADRYLHESHGEYDSASIEAAIRKLRSYQQKSHGPLVPTLTATYRHKNEGVSVRLAWFDESLHVNAHAPFAAELDEHFLNTAPIDGITDFTTDCFPEQFGDYHLGLVTKTNLFRYEL